MYMKIHQGILYLSYELIYRMMVTTEIKIFYCIWSYDNTIYSLYISYKVITWQHNYNLRPQNLPSDIKNKGLCATFVLTSSNRQWEVCGRHFGSHLGYLMFPVVNCKNNGHLCISLFWKHKINHKTLPAAVEILMFCYWFLVS